MNILSRFLERRNWRRRARAYVRALQREPDDADVRWLTGLEPARDMDHARWELRYARLALGLIAAERDSLDDRVPAAVAREVFASLQRDARVAATMLQTAERHLNARLGAYREAMAARTASESIQVRLGRALMSFTNEGYAFDRATHERAGETLRRYLGEHNTTLQDVFGRAALPENVRPSEATAA